MKHIVMTFDLSGKFIKGDRFETAEKAYNEYMNIIDTARKVLPIGSGIQVVRLVDDAVMAIETVKGTH